jgi:antirestriction protein ArdC
MAATTSEIRFADLLQRAVTEPGILSRAYSQFHDFSLGNVLLAYVQCLDREIPFGPIATYRRWQELGRQVRKGQKAITLCQPITIKKASEAEPSDEAAGGVFVRFMFRPHWFVMAQTDGHDVPAVELPEWTKARALAGLNVTEIPFTAVDGNALGYARARELAINPVNPLPFKTLFHELAHILLGHTAEGQQADSEITPRSLREAEAEAVALLCCDALGLPGEAEARGYIQHWYGAGNAIPEGSAKRIMRVADQILKAGRPAVSSEDRS